MPLSLDSLTLTDTSPADLIRAAAAAGFDLVSLWVQPPAVYPLALLTADAVRTCAALLADTGVGVVSLEVFDLVSPDAIEGYRPALEVGARLGGKVAVAINFDNPDPASAADALALFAATAAQCGLGVNLEPVAGGRCATLAQARDLIRASGADVGITFDPHHLMRVGGSVADVRALEPGIIRYVQLCDGPLIPPPDLAAVEAVAERAYPGDGAFPLVELLRALPGDLPVAIECPSLRRANAGISPAAQAAEALASVRRLLALLA